MKLLKMIALALAAVAMAAQAWAADGEFETVNALGMGKTYNAAVADALSKAVKQHNGTSVSVTESLSIGESMDDGGVSVADSFKHDSKLAAAGQVKGYDVAGVNFNESTGLYEVTVAARFDPPPPPPKPFVLDNGDNPADRRRMAVQTFRPHGDTVSVRGETISTVEWASSLADKLNTALSDTRKFTMLDRHFDAEVNDELARINMQNASKADLGRLGQLLATDYLVVGEIRFSSVAPARRHPVTLQVLAEGPQLFAEISYRVLLVPTGQLKFSGIVKIDTAKVPERDAGAFIVASTAYAAQKIADEIMADILPFEIVDFEDGVVTIGQGGSTLAVGERFTVFALGKTVYDTRTGEAIAQKEIPVGTVEVFDVQPKLAYAKIVGETIRTPAEGMVLRRVKNVPVKPAAPRVPVAVPAPVVPATQLQLSPAGGIVAPF